MPCVDSTPRKLKRTRPFGLIVALLVLAPILGRSQTTQSLETWFPQLREGIWVKVDGAMRDGDLHADEIKIYAGELDEWEISSNIVKVDLQEMTLVTEFGVAVQASERTDLQGPEDHREIGR